jgi:hypothetical protein
VGIVKPRGFKPLWESVSLLDFQSGNLQNSIKERVPEPLLAEGGSGSSAKRRHVFTAYFPIRDYIPHGNAASPNGHGRNVTSDGPFTASGG